MLRVASPSVVPRIESLFNGGSAAGLSDRQLLERFIARRDSTAEAAFAALVARHGPMVLGVCRQLLGDRHHAEDAFQAVFLVLARKARSIRDPELLGNWLYGVALRTARKARVRLARRRKRRRTSRARRADVRSAVPAVERSLDASRPRPCTARSTACRPPSACRWCSATSRALTLDEAARRLRWPAGTLRSRLVRAPRQAPPRSGSTRAWSCPPPAWPRHWRPGQPRRRSHPTCATRPPGPRPTSRPDVPRRGSAFATALGPGGAEIHAAPQAETHSCSAFCSSPPSPQARDSSGQALAIVRLETA